MSIRYTHFYDELQALVDSIMHDSDESQRLANLQKFYKDGMSLMIRARDEAAYDLRTTYSSEDSAILSGVNRRDVDYWATRYRKRNGLPTLKKRKRVDLSNAIDLSER